MPKIGTYHHDPNSTVELIAMGTSLYWYFLSLGTKKVTVGDVDLKSNGVVCFWVGIASETHLKSVIIHDYIP